MRNLALAVLLAAASAAALAERADRDKPIQIEADRMAVDDRNKISTFEGRVTMTQGTLVIRAGKVVVSQDAEGYQKGIATGGEGGLARFRQKREGRDEYVEGEAERIEHNTRNEQTEFFNRAYVKSGQDEVRGQYIRVDGVTENYLVTNGPGGSVTPSASGKDAPRVRATLQPRGKDTAKPPAPAPQGANPARSETK